jgi:hypothetical protein
MADENLTRKTLASLAPCDGIIRIRFKGSPALFCGARLSANWLPCWWLKDVAYENRALKPQKSASPNVARCNLSPCAFPHHYETD